MFAGKLFQAKGVWIVLMATCMAVAMTLVAPMHACCMAIEDYVKLFKDKNVVARENFISFYGVEIYPDRNKGWETDVIGCTPIVATHGKNKIIDPGVPSDGGMLEADLFCAGDLVDVAAVAVNFPENGMISMAIDMAGVEIRGLYAVQVFTAWQGKIYTTRYYGRGPTDSLVQVFGAEPGLVPTWNDLWSICGLGEKCPHVCFQCPGCVANTVHYIAFRNGKWADSKPGEHAEAYRKLYKENKAMLDAFVKNNISTPEQLSSDHNMQTRYTWYLAHVIYPSIMEGLSDAECMERMKQYISPECGREFLSQIREAAIERFQIQMTTAVY